MSANYNNISMLDMVFEHRNKTYGAYVHRMEYNKTVQQAMLSILSVLTLFCLGNFIRENLHAANKNTHTTDHTFVTADISKVAAPAQVKPPVQPPKKAMGVATAANTEKRVVTNDKATDTIPATKDIANLESGITANASTNTGLGATDGTGSGYVLEVAQQVAPPQSEVFAYVEKMPEYPGGEKELMKFLAKNTSYPDMERQNGIAGKVITQFTVNEDGTISDIKILRSPSNGFNKEVSRVIKMLPAFKPGMQQGHAVKVRYILPIAFNVAD